MTAPSVVAVSRTMASRMLVSRRPRNERGAAARTGDHRDQARGDGGVYVDAAPHRQDRHDEDAAGHTQTPPSALAPQTPRRARRRTRGRIGPVIRDHRHPSAAFQRRVTKRPDRRDNAASRSRPVDGPSRIRCALDQENRTARCNPEDLRQLVPWRNRLESIVGLVQRDVVFLFEQEKIGSVSKSLLMIRSPIVARKVGLVERKRHAIGETHALIRPPACRWAGQVAGDLRRWRDRRVAITLAVA